MYGCIDGWRTYGCLLSCLLVRCFFVTHPALRVTETCHAVCFSKLVAGQANVEQLQKEAEATWDPCASSSFAACLSDRGVTRYDNRPWYQGYVGLHADKLHQMKLNVKELLTQFSSRARGGQDSDKGGARNEVIGSRLVFCIPLHLEPTALDLPKDPNPKRV